MAPLLRSTSVVLLATVTIARAGLDESSVRPALRVYSRGSPTWVYAEPRRTERVLGHIRRGQSLRLREPKPRAGPGCPKGFVAVEPFGWVCLDPSATLDGKDPAVAVMAPFDPAPSPLPYQYALSNGAPMYRRLPTREEWNQSERFYPPAGSHGKLSWGNRGHELLAETRAIVPDPIGAELRQLLQAVEPRSSEVVRREIPLGSMLAYRGAVEHQGRTFLFSADGTVVPADRVRPYRPSSFHGVELGSAVDLPLAWIRGRARPKYQATREGRLEKTGEEWSLRTWVALDPDLPPVHQSGERYIATREGRGNGRHWIAETDATMVHAANPHNWGVGDHESWLLISITAGTLVAYQGKRAVFSTLVSPGAGGVPRPGQDPVKMSTTPLGTYRVSFKHRTTTMSPEQGENRKFWIAEVPYTQYFSAPFALHTAYWHENFGELMSAGCINLSPQDGQWLFGWTQPRVPPEWNGAAPGALTGPGTVVVVVR